MNKKSNYLVTWYDTELEYDDSEVIMAKSKGEAEQTISEGNKFAVDIYAEEASI